MGRTYTNLPAGPLVKAAAWGVLGTSLFLAGCASGQGCEGRTGGWLSGWGNTRGGNAVTVGVHRAWWDCQDRTLTTPAARPAPTQPVPSADPMADVPVAR